MKRADPPEPRPVPRSGVVALRPVDDLTRVQLAAGLRELDLGMEDGLRGLDEHIPCPPCGEIELLALDIVNQLTIVEFDAVASDNLLVRGLAHADWIMRNIGNVRRMYSGRTINFSAPPRVILVAPAFSPSVLRAAQFVARPQIDCIVVRAVQVNHGVGLLFENRSQETDVRS